MKRIKLYISLLFIICTHYGMSQCIINPEFATIGSAYTNQYCYFDDDYVVNWHRSHGTPQYHRNASNPNASFMYMWATYDNRRGPVGEGIWASYNFQANHQYKIKVAAYDGGDNGNLVVVAANNVPTTTASLYCQGEDLPSVTGTTLVMNQPLPGWSTTFTEYVITFTPTVNYSQIWIYPSTWDYRVEMYVDYVSVCEDPCTGYITYNSGAVPGGETRAGFIYAGSSTGTGGSGTVTVQNGLTTSFIGGHEVFLQPNFHVQLTSGEFRALIYECPPLQTRVQSEPSKYPSVQAILDPRGIPPAKIMGTKRDDSSSLARARPGPGSMAIYPNPVRNKLSVRLSNFNGNIAGMQVVNEVGVVVQQIDRKVYADKQNLEIDVSQLPAGMFILRVITDRETFTQKFQKMK